MNTRRITTRLKELQIKDSLTESEAGELKALADIVRDDIEATSGGPLDLTLPGSTEVNTGINVADPILTDDITHTIDTAHGDILRATKAERTNKVRAGIALAVGLTSAVLTQGATGPAVAGLVLTALKAAQAAKEA